MELKSNIDFLIKIIIIFLKLFSSIFINILNNLGKLLSPKFIGLPFIIKEIGIMGYRLMRKT